MSSFNTSFDSDLSSESLDRVLGRGWERQGRPLGLGAGRVDTSSLVSDEETLDLFLKMDDRSLYKLDTGCSLLFGS